MIFGKEFLVFFVLVTAFQRGVAMNRKDFLQSCWDWPRVSEFRASR